MFDSKITNRRCAPVAIGGIGGSGTRLIAQLLKEVGFYIGSDINAAYDNLWFTLLFKRIEILSASDNEFEDMVEIFSRGMTGKGLTEAQIESVNRLAFLDRTQHSSEWLKERAKSLLSKQQSTTPIVAWGWKEPNTHIVINRLQQSLPNMKYIHVMRNGLDMAHSSNQNQINNWGAHIIGPTYNLSPYYSLKFWCKVHQQLLSFCKPMGDRFLLLNFDKFCFHPTRSIKNLLKFLEVEIPETQINYLANLVRVPESIGRFKQHGLHIFEPADISYVRQLGFMTDLK